jgi:SAM-dependent methyltransferase
MEDLRKKQYALEKKHHDILLKEPDPKRRQRLYKKAYDEIYAFYREQGKKSTFGFFEKSYRLYLSFIKNKIVVDYGCGYGAFTRAVAPHAKAVYGVDASKEVIEKAQQFKKKNVQFLCQQSVELPFTSSSIDFFFSTGVLEHLHPDDAQRHLEEVYRCLVKGGRYVMITPNRYFGPSDVSKHFLKRGAVAQGLHLKEYTYAGIMDIVDQIGFSSVKTPAIVEQSLSMMHMPWLFRYVLLPAGYKKIAEKLLSSFPKVIAEIVRVRAISLVLQK